VYSGHFRAYPGGRKGRSEIEMTASMLRIRRKEARKVAKLARAFASLDEHAAAVRPAPRRTARLSFGR
jgi:hypothetical protein